MPENVKHSIFKRNIIEKNFSVDIIYQVTHSLNVYGHTETREKKIINDVSCNIGNEIVAEIDVEMPLLEVGETFDICEINESVTIKERMRNSKGCVTYIVDDKIIYAPNYQENIDKFMELKSTNYKLERLEDTVQILLEIFKKLNVWWLKGLLNKYLMTINTGCLRYSRYSLSINRMIEMLEKHLVKEMDGET